MTDRPIEFLINANGQAPRNLRDAIRRVHNSSHGFRSSWLAGDLHGAYETSQEAFVELDYIQNELLRQRDARNNAAAWLGSQLEVVLQSNVGRICSPVSAQDASWFRALPSQAGCLPPGSTPDDLSLGAALNKLKHRTTSLLNFYLPANGGHLLYVLTSASMGKPETLCEIDVLQFCSNCTAAAACV